MCSRVTDVGFLHSASPAPFARAVDAFRKGLSETGYIEGRNVAVEYRWAEGQYNRLPALADRAGVEHHSRRYDDGTERVGNFGARAGS